ncbi:MAG: AzlD domain-containing protein [Dermatophilaceae bacterium]
MVIVVLGLANAALKAAGPLAFANHEFSPSTRTVLASLTPAVLAALVVSSVVVDRDTLVLDARAAGLAAAAVALCCRMPLPIVIVAAALATAMVRALGQ